MELEIIFSQFNINTRGWKNFEMNYRLDPTYSSVKKYFPNAKLTLFTDDKRMADGYDDVEVKVVDEKDFIQSKQHKKWGWNNADYYQIYGLLNSSAEVAISVDSDIMFVNEEVKTIVPIIKKFGVCCPINVRGLVKIDGIHGNDGDYRIGEDESRGNITTYDLWWNGFHTKNSRARKLLEEFARLMKENPKRSPLQYSRAAWNTGIHPYVLPKQWGVGCRDVGCGEEIILHLGHIQVQDYYLENRI